MRFSVDVRWAVLSAVCFSLGAMAPAGLTMGQTVNHSPLYTFDGDDAEDRLGQSVSGAGDVNGDGFADFIVGAPADDNNGLNSGSARVFVSHAIGDFDLDGDVDADDIDFYSGIINQLVTDELAPLDLDSDGVITLADHNLHITTLVETSNGQKGTFLGDVNLDGSVDVLGDAFVLVSNLGGAGGYAEGDFNADQVVDVLIDAFALIDNLGQSNANGSAVIAPSFQNPVASD